MPLLSPRVPVYVAFIASPPESAWLADVGLKRLRERVRLQLGAFRQSDTTPTVLYTAISCFCDGRIVGEKLHSNGIVKQNERPCLEDLTRILDHLDIGYEIRPDPESNDPIGNMALFLSQNPPTKEEANP